MPMSLNRFPLASLKHPAPFSNKRLLMFNVGFLSNLWPLPYFFPLARLLIAALDDAGSTLGAPGPPGGKEGTLM